ncbi:MAG: flippase activity-associated protein Agl23, partial [Lentisphaerota bacterium]
MKSQTVDQPPLWRRMEKPAWLALLALSLILRCYGLEWRALSYDEGVHAIYSHYLFANGQYSHTPVTHGPFLFVSNALIFSLLGESDATVRIGQAMAGAGVVFMMWYFRRYLGRAGALAAGLLLSVSPVFLFYSRYARNDIYIALFLLLWIYSALRYLGSGRFRWLLGVTLSMALSFATKEVSFLNGAIAGSFFALTAFFHLTTKPVLAQRARRLAVMMLFLVLPFLAPLIRQKSYMTIGSLFLLDLFFITAWFHARSSERFRPAHGLALLLLFWAIDLPLFTTFFHNRAGVLTGISGSLGYWLAQHGVQRGNQPWFYYPFLAVLYEFLPLALSVSGVALLALRRKNTSRMVFTTLCLWWMAGSWTLYS